MLFNETWPLITSQITANEELVCWPALANQTCTSEFPASDGESAERADSPVKGGILGVYDSYSVPVCTASAWFPESQALNNLKDSTLYLEMVQSEEGTLYPFL